MLSRTRGWMMGGALLAILPLAACGHHDSHAVHHDHPSHVEHIDGTDLSKVTLTERAMERTDVRTGHVSEDKGRGRKVVPYSSILYDPHGDTWVYTSPEPRTFVRAKIDIDRIEGDNVYLNDGPPVGTVVATVGVAEIYGSEFEVGH